MRDKSQPPILGVQTDIASWVWGESGTESITVPKQYYSLIIRWNDSDTFGIEFGDYDFEAVKDALENMHDENPEHTYRIMATADDQAAIAKGLASFNPDPAKEEKDAFRAYCKAVENGEI